MSLSSELMLCTKALDPNKLPMFSLQSVIKYPLYTVTSALENNLNCTADTSYFLILRTYIRTYVTVRTLQYIHIFPLLDRYVASYIVMQ